MTINLIEILFGFAFGFATGAGFVAILTLLNIVPRLIQLSQSNKYLKVFIGAIFFGSLFGTLLSFSRFTLPFNNVLLMIWGLFHGVFNGLLAAALAEVLNVFPILFRRIKAQQYQLILFMAIVFGKVFGSLFQWLIYVKF